MIFFLGNSNQNLGKKVSEAAGIAIGKMDIVRFGDSEIKPRILSNVRDEEVIVFQSTSNPVNDHLMELVLICDALRRSSAKKIIAVIPYFGYARQNQQHLGGEPVSAQVVAKMIESVGADELITLDLHEEQTTGFFEIPINHLSALPLLAKKVINYLDADCPLDKNRFAVASPDQGGVERTRLFAKTLGIAETVLVEKKRNLEIKHESKVVEVSGNVSGKTVIIPDDVIVSGGTILNAANSLIAKGAEKVFLAATHADFIKGTGKKLQSSKVEKVFVTDTIQLQERNIFEKLRVVSVAGLLADALNKLKT